MTYLKQITALLLMTAFMAQSFSKVFIVFDYYTNTAAFAEKCENKARPSMHCNGKCQMMKKLKQEDKREDKAPEKRNENRNEPAISDSCSFQLKINPPLELNNPYIVSNDRLVVCMPRFCFHPPSC